MITILSTPRTGTRFWYHFVTRVLGRDARYAHFSARTIDAITDYLSKTDDVIIVPMRDCCATFDSAHKENAYLIEDSLAARAMFMHRLRVYGAHFMDTIKNDNTAAQITTLLTDLDIEMNETIERYVEAWQPIGSQHSNDATSEVILAEMLRCKSICKLT